MRKRIIRLFLRIMLVITVLVTGIILGVRTPYVQSKITNYATIYLNETTGGTFSIERVFLTFDFNLQLNGVHVFTPEADTLLIVNALEAGVHWRPLLDRTIVLTPLHIDGLTARIKQTDDDRFSFSFITDAFANEQEEIDVPIEETEKESKPWSFQFSTVELSNIDLSFSDHQECEYEARFKRLYINPKTIDWDEGIYALHSLTLESPDVSITLCNASTDESDTTASSPIPGFSIDALDINHTRMVFQSDGLYMHLASGDIALRNAVLDDFVIELARLDVKNIDFALQTPPSTDLEDSSKTDDDIELPKWAITINEANVDAERIDVDETLKIHSLEWAAKNISYTPHPSQPQISITQHTLRYQSSTDIPSINALSFVLSTDQTGVSVSQGHVNALSNTLDFAARLEYEHIEQIFKTPFERPWEVQINAKAIDLKGVEPMTDMEAIPSLVRKRQWNLAVDAKGIGTDNIDLNNLQLQHPEGFVLAVSGKATALSDSNNRSVNWSLNHLDVKGAIMRDIQAAYAPDEINFPRYLTASSKGKYQTDAIDAFINLNSDVLQFNGEAKTVLGIHRLNGKLEANNLNFGEQHLDNLRASITLGTANNPLDNANITLKINHLLINDVPVSDIELDAVMANNNYTLTLSSKDPNAEVDLTASGRVDSTEATSQLRLDIARFRPNAFGITDNAITFISGLDVRFRFSSTNDFDARLDIDSLFFRKNRRVIQYESMFVDVASTPERLDLNVDLRDIQMDVHANQPLDLVIKDVQNYTQHVLGLADTTMTHNLDLNVQVDVSTGLILELLGNDYRIGKDTLRLQAHYRRDQNISLGMDFYLPEIYAPGLYLGAFRLNAQGNKNSVNVSMALEDLNVQDFDLGKTHIDAALSAQSFGLNIANWKDEYLRYRVKSSNRIYRDSLLVHIDPDTLLLNGMNWTMHEDNQLNVGQHIIANNWELRKSGESFSIITDDEGESRSLALNFDGFNIATISAILNEKEPPVTGEINGTFKQITQDNERITLADIRLDSLHVLTNEIGNLSLLAEQMEDRKIAVDLGLIGPHIDLNINGFYGIYDDKPDYDLGVELKRLDLKLLELFGRRILRDTRGHIALTAILQGHGSDYSYNGSLRFSEAGFNIAAINTPFTLSDEKISVENQRITFERFRMLDVEKRPLTVDGYIDLTELRDPELALSINAKRFRLLGSSRIDNDLFFGDLLVDARIDISGEAKEPIIDMEAKLLEGTNLTFIVPESEADVMDRRSVVKIVDRSLPDSLRPRVEALSTLEMGLFLNAILKADPSTTFSIIIDEQAGDRLDISGEANLSLQIDPSGAIQISGLYNITKGAYELNFYDLVKRKFELSPNSSIRWNGDPLMADLDINAIYKLRTSPMELMVEQIGPNRELQQPYRREQPFEVVMNIEGELLRPELSFDLDMPENARGAVNGSIYSRIQQLRQDENERNQQTFALIVLNQFVPTGRGGPGAGAGEMARSSASRMISQQLNQLSGRYIKGLDVELGLDSYTDHEEGQDRTDLNVRVGRTFLDDRLTVQAGGQFEIEGNRNAEGNNPNQFMGDVNVEYSLTEDGRYRLRAFRRNDWQGAVEGQVITTGASLIFQREFDSFSELIRSLWKQKPDDETND